MTRKTFERAGRLASEHIKAVLAMLAVLWLLELVDTVILAQWLNRFGIVPRASDGISGIAFAPLLHVNLTHLLANTAPFAFCAVLLLARSRGEFVAVTIAVWLLSGLGVWLLGQPNSVHIGASGVIFGYFGFLLTRAVFDRDLVSIGIAILVGAVYGGVLVGMLPTAEIVSWQGHLSGFVGGGVTARVMAHRA
jgi:membrane associated rhomboid family serine protease